MPSDSKERFAALLDRFARAWERGATDDMVGVFASDAVFLPTPFDPPARGHEAIRKYWRDIPREQAEISFRYGEIYVAGPWFATEFKCTFRRRRTGQPVDLRGSVFCETAGDTITEMRLYWHRELTEGQK